MSRKILVYVCLVIIVIFAKVNQTTASQDIRPTTPLTGSGLLVHNSLEIIASYGCLPGMLSGDLLRTEAELVRLIKAARDCLDTHPLVNQRGMVRHLVELLEKQFDVDGKGTGFHLKKPLFAFNYFYFQDDSRNIPSIEGGKLSPWTSNREGIDYSPGSNLTFQSLWQGSLDQWFDLSI